MWGIPLLLAWVVLHGVRKVRCVPIKCCGFGGDFLAEDKTDSARGL